MRLLVLDKHCSPEFIKQVFPKFCSPHTPFRLFSDLVKFAGTDLAGLEAGTEDIYLYSLVVLLAEVDEEVTIR